MPDAASSPGRRERNKQAKLERIVRAAGELFAERGVDDVTTQEIADAADIGTGTLFLYAKTKGELLLLVQNTHYAEALERGRSAAANEHAPVQAILALLAPVVACNRVQVDNGRTYLREMVFGNPAEPHHADALAIVAQTEHAVADILVQRADADPTVAATLARVISAAQFLTMASSAHTDSTVDQLLDELGRQLVALLPR